MKTRWERFNIYLLLAAAAAAVALCGCQSAAPSKPGKLLAVLRLHLETTPDGTNTLNSIPVYRLNPVQICAQKHAFLDEGHVAEAKVIEVVGGFALWIKFNSAGTALFEEYTTANRGRRIAVFSQFGERIKDSRWLAAPIISRRVTDGIFTFTPDATRSEAEEIALGLNNVARKVQK